MNPSIDSIVETHRVSRVAASRILEKCIRDTAKILNVSVEHVKEIINPEPWSLLLELPLEIVDHISTFLPLKDFLNLCVVHRDMNSLAHRPTGRKAYVNRYTIIKYFRGFYGVYNKRIQADQFGKLGNLDTSMEWWYNGRRHREDDQPALVTSKGERRWYFYGKLHREGDRPAVIKSDGTQEWYDQGILHRENDLPAVIESDGTQKWYHQGALHRENDLPAVVESDGTQKWYHQGALHRDNDLPAVVDPDGAQAWYHHGRLHRGDDKPAVIESDGTREWYQNEKLHRGNGLPARIFGTGDREWFKHGKLIKMGPPEST